MINVSEKMGVACGLTFLVMAEACGVLARGVDVGNPEGQRVEDCGVDFGGLEDVSIFSRVAEGVFYGLPLLLVLMCCCCVWEGLGMIEDAAPLIAIAALPLAIPPK